jgi:hypothetical protein
MKKNNFCIVTSLLAALTVISSCTKDSQQDLPEKVITTPVQIEAEISRSVLFDGNTNIEYYFTVWDNNVLVNSAVITVNGITVPRIIGFFDGYYDLREYNTPSASYVPGATYNVSVTYGGKTYTESLKAPGGFTANSDYSKIQWGFNGTYGTLDVYHLYGSTTYTTPSARPTALASPQSIPATAYPSAGQYTVHVWGQNIKNKAFGTLSGDNCHILVEDFVEWRITK